MAHISGLGSRAAAALIAAGGLLQAQHATAQAPCDAPCQAAALGWRVIDPGPPLWIESGKTSTRIEVAVAEPGNPPGITGADIAGWLKSQLTGPLGAFGALGACQGRLAAGADKVTVLQCSVPAGRDGPRHAALLAVATAAGTQVIGAVAPLTVNLNPLHSSALLRLAHAEREALTPAGTVRAAIATLTGAAYYASTDAGASGPPIEGVYHVWNGPLNDKDTQSGADFVLFKNGEVWRNPGAGPRDIDPIKFKEARWVDSGSWRRQDGGFALTFNGQDAMLMPEGKFRRYEPATQASQQQLDGLWQWGPGQALWLHADGRFEVRGQSSALTLTRVAERIPSSVHGAAPQPAAPAAAVSRGRYRIEGYTLDLSYDDGRQGSALFYWAGDLNHDRYALCIINGAQWLGERARSRPLKALNDAPSPPAAHGP